ncbi:MAG TPA: aspartyl protease family protein [Sphingomicrobium sp.]|nr:aspartyl protease family protein [Sphingomicrobium sp.]
MKRQTRIGLGLIGFAAAASLYPCFAEAQIATPTVAAIPGAAHEVPFELFRDSRIFLKGRVNGNATPMILDSGAGVTTIDRDFAKAIGIKKGIPLTAQGVGGQAQGELVQDVTIEIGNLKLSGVSVAVLDLDPIEKAIGRPMPVILGHELFMNSVVGLDFDNKLLTLSPAGNFRAPAGATEVRLKREGTLHFLPIAVDGHAPVEAALDLGNGGALSLSKEYHESVPDIGNLHYAVGLSGGVGGLHETRRVSMPKVEVGGFTFDDVPTDLGSVGEGPYHGRANAGIQLFKPFTLTLDLGHDRLWLKRTAKAPTFTKDRAGMFVMLEDDHFNVLHVTPGSPAEQAGLKKGDRLTAIGGERVGPGFYTSKEANWSRLPAGTRVEVAKADGQTVTLTLADYY